MANARRSLAKPKKQIVFRTKSEVYLINKKYIGDEPEVVKGVISGWKLSDVLTWYNYMCTKKNAREYLEDFFKVAGRKSDLQRLKKVPDSWLPLTDAWIARMVVRGWEFSQDTLDRSSARVKACLGRSYKADETEGAESPTVEKPKVSIDSRMRDRLSDILGEIEAAFDEACPGPYSKRGWEPLSLYDLMTKMQVPAAYAPKIADYYRPQAEEVRDALAGKDKQLAEGYASWGKKGLRSLSGVLDSMVSDAERYGSNRKKTTSVRKPKPMSVEKKLKDFRFMKEYPDKKLASVSPEKILGAPELWVFNTKYSTITVFRALDRGGLDVKRSSIVNFDPNNSTTFKTGRKTDHFVEQVLKSGKVTLRKLTGEVKGSPQRLQERINEHTVLLRVVT